jgi:Serine dehydrogenase proteinase
VRGNTLGDAMDTIKCNDAIEMILEQANSELSEHFASEVIFLKASLEPPIDDFVKDEIEELRQQKNARNKLTVFVETDGGFVETVERIVSVFRKHYDVVEYVIPNFAYSAGTILVLSGDELYMDYYSVLGPIDPQIDMGEEGSVPGMGYLAKFKELLAEINDPGREPEETRGQLAYLIKRFDPAILFTIEQAIEHSKSLLRAWLPKYKFKSWAVKETSGEPVTPADRQQRADDIATILGNAGHWHSHGRGIGIKDLESDLIKLKVVNYGDDKALNGNISHYYGLLIDYMRKNGHKSILHSSRGLRKLA